MLLFGKKCFCAPPREVIGRLKDVVSATPRPSLEQAREWLVFAGQLEQAVRDGGGWPGLAEITLRAAGLFLTVRDGGEAAAARQELLHCLSHGLRHLGGAEVTLRIPEGFAWYALYPESYALTAARWAKHNRGRAVAVIGVLSIGTSLSAVVAEQLKRCGVNVVARMAIRPRGHPFRRMAELDGELPSAQAFLIVDEGPGLSGSSMTGVAEALHGRGAAADAIVFFPGHGGGPGHHSGASQRKWWSKERCWVTPGEDLGLNGTHPGTLELFGGFAAVNRRLDPLWAVKHERQQRLAEKGFALPCRGVAHGWIAIADAGTPLGPQDGNASFIQHRLAPHITAAAMPCENMDDAEMALERIAAAIIAFAQEHRPDLPEEKVRRMTETAMREGLPPLFHGDGRLSPGEWVRLPDGRILKCNATGTDWEHSWAGPQSVLWDIAGAAIEWHMTRRALTLFLDVLAERFGIRAGPAALAYHAAGYCCLALARARHAQDHEAAGRYEARLAAALRQMEALA